MSAPSAPLDRGAAHERMRSSTILAHERPAGDAAGDRLSEYLPQGSGRADAFAHFTAPAPDPALTENATPYLPRGVRLAHDTVRGMRVLHAPERAMQLDPIGEAILTALDGRTLGAIIDALAAKYAAPRNEIATDVTAFLQGLIDRRMVFVRLP